MNSLKQNILIGDSHWVMINPSPCSWGGPQWLWQWGGNPRGLRLCDACAVGTRGGAQDHRSGGFKACHFSLDLKTSSFFWALNIFTHTHQPRGIGCLGFLQFSWYILNCWKPEVGQAITLVPMGRSLDFVARTAALFSVCFWGWLVLGDHDTMCMQCL